MDIIYNGYFLSWAGTPQGLWHLLLPPPFSLTIANLSFYFQHFLKGSFWDDSSFWQSVDETISMSYSELIYHLLLLHAQLPMVPSLVSWECRGRGSCRVSLSCYSGLRWWCLGQLWFLWGHDGQETRGLGVAAQESPWTAITDCNGWSVSRGRNEILRAWGHWMTVCCVHKCLLCLLWDLGMAPSEASKRTSRGGSSLSELMVSKMISRNYPWSF